MTLTMKEKLTHRCRKQTYSCRRMRGREEMDWEFGVSRCKLSHIGWIHNKGEPYLPYLLYLLMIIEKNIERNPCVCIPESLCRTAEINTPL